jgi:hypothetical protein
MKGIQKILGLVFPSYKQRVQRNELTLLVDSLINSLPAAFHELKEQRKKTNLFFLSDWALFPGFKFMSIGYPGTTLNDFKKRGQNYRLSGQRIYSKRENDYVGVEFIINDNYIAGLRIENSNYQVEEFDLKRIEVRNIKRTPVKFPPSELDLFYERLDENLKSKLNPDDIFDISFGHRTYYAFYDLEDGNYLATDKKLNVYSLVHDARPMAKKLKSSFAEILEEIETKAFDASKHVEERYKNGL